METNRYKLSPQQLKVWSLNKQGFYPYLKCTVEIDKSVNVENFKTCIRDVLLLHEVFRLRISTESDNLPLCQFINESTHRFTFINKNDSESDPESVPAFRDDYFHVNLKEIEKDKFRVYFVSSTLLLDAKSFINIINSTLCLFELRIDPPVPSVQYLQFSEWQHQLLENKDEEADAFWRSILAKSSTTRTLNFGKTHVPKDNTQSLAEIIDSSLRKKLLFIAEQQNTSIEVILLAAWQFLISNYINENQITIAYTSDKRLFEEIKNTVGPIAKSVPIVHHYSENDTLTTHLQSLKNTLNDSEEYKLEFDGRINEDEVLTFDIGFDFFEPVLDPVLKDRYKIFNFQCNSELNSIRLSCIDLNDNVRLELYYDKLNFDKDTLKLLLTQYLTMLKALSSGESNSFDLNAAGYECLPSQKMSDGRSFSYREGLLGSLLNKMKDSYSKPALIFGDKSMTYYDLDKRSDALAKYISQAGFKRGNVIGILGEPSESTVIAMLAVLKSGCTFLPIDSENPSERVEYILKDADVKLLLTTSQNLGKLSNTSDLHLFALDIQLEELQPGEYGMGAESNAHDIAYIIYTSGTTGFPKGVEITLDSFANYLFWANDYYFSGKSGFTFPFFTSIGFDLSLTSVFTTLLRGDTIRIYDYKNIDKTLVDIFSSQSGINCVKLTPSHISLISALKIADSEVTHIISGGEQLTTNHVRTLKKLNGKIKIYNEYGPTETTVGCSACLIDDNLNAVSIGSPIYNTSIKILDRKGKETAFGTEGEIYIGGACLAKGYKNAEELTARSFVKIKNARFYKTGDMGKWLPDGNILFLGRNDDQVKLRGYRISCKEIEKALISHQGIHTAIVLHVRQDETREAITAYYLGEETESENIRQFLLNKLPSYMIPSYFIKIQKVPLTANGKLNRNELPDPFVAGTQHATNYCVPRNYTERKLVEIWQDVLGRDKIGITDVFFEIGGHSLNGVQVLSRIYKELNADIELRAIFNYPTIEALSAQILSAPSTLFESLKKLPESEFYPASYGQRRIWMASKLKENLMAYNLPGAFIITGDLILENFTYAIGEVIKRHEILRTNVQMQGESLMQKIGKYDKERFKTDYIDLSNVVDQEVVVDGFLNSFSNRFFDLESDPLIATTLIKLENGKYLFLYVLHHIISDGKSIEILISELMEIYNAHIKNSEAKLNTLPVQYKEYADWHNNLVSSETGESLQKYWMSRFSGDLPKLNIKQSKTRPLIQTFNGNYLVFNIEQEEYSMLSELCNSKSATMFMAVMSTVKVLLSVLGDTNDIIIGSPVSGRNHMDLEKQVGFYLNTVPFRTNLDEKDTLESIIEKVKSLTLEAYANQFYPFDLLLADLKIIHDKSRNALFDVGFTFNNRMASEDVRNSFVGLKIDDYDIGFRSVKTDLWINVFENAQSLDFKIEYNTDLFARKTMESIVQTYKLILSTILNERGVTLAKLKEKVDDLEKGKALINDNQLHNKDLEILKRLSN